MELTEPQKHAIGELENEHECHPNITLTHMMPMQSPMVFVMFGTEGYLIDHHGTHKLFLPDAD